MRVRGSGGWALVTGDAVSAAFAYTLALLLRFVDLGVPGPFISGFLVVLPLLLAAHLAANGLAGAYRDWVPSRIMVPTVAVTVLALVSVIVVRSSSGEMAPVPLSVILMGGLLALFGMLIVRLVALRLG